MNIRNAAAGSGLVIAAAAAASLLVGPKQNVSASTDDLPRIVTVSGSGEMKVKPDMAVVTSGVTTEAATAKAALTKNNAAMAAVMKALKDAGIDEDDIQTSNFSVSPVYASPQPGHASSPQISSYQVSNQVTVRIRKLSGLGSTLDSLVQAGSNQVNGISFDVADPSSVTNEARRKAIADARAKAELYAGAAGASVGSVMQISEVSMSPVMPVRYRMAEVATDASVPMAPGMNTLTANVTVTFEMR
jgi:uncharacterized protein YggE